MKKFFVIFALIGLTGCGLTQQGDAARTFILEKAIVASDQTARNALNYLCSFIRIRSLNQLFPSETQRQAHAILCAKPITVFPILPTSSTEPGVSL